MSTPDPVPDPGPPRADPPDPRLARAEPVGSLLRPEFLLRVRRAHAEGRVPPAELKAAEDRAVDAAVAMQEAAGLPVVTDGEMRRASFQAPVAEAVEGLWAPGLDAWLWGRWKGDEEVGDRSTPRPEGLGVDGPLRRRRSFAAEELVYLRARAKRAVPKLALPSPALFANFWTPDDPPDAYPDLGAFLEDVARVLAEEVRELARLGARYLQIDAPHYPLLRDPETAPWYEALGWSRGEWVERSVALENRVMGAAPGLTWALHVCRGNQDSRWLAEGGYAPLARPLFGETRADRLLLEYDDARSGGFEPLEAVPPDKVVVLGLVTTKRPAREDPDALVDRVREAARYVPLQRLAVSPQCGFASSVVGNRLALEDQIWKLAAVAETARRVWG